MKREHVIRLDDESVQAIRVAFNSIPRHRFSRPSVIVALAGPNRVVKSLEGYDASADPIALTAAVRANPCRFFIASPEHLVCAPVRRIDGRWIAWAVTRGVLEAILDAAEVARVRLLGITMADATHAGDAGSSPRWHWDPLADVRGRKRRTVRRGGLIATMLLGLSVGAFAPWLRPLVSAIPPALADVERGRAEQAATDLRAHVAALTAIDTLTAFVSSGRSVIGMLSELSARLPAPSAIVSLRFDRQGVTFVALTPGGAAVLPALSRLDGVTSAQLVGAVTRETMDGHDVQRVAATMSLARTSQ